MKPRGKAAKSGKNNQPKSKSGRGGKRPNAGRKPGSANKITVLIKASLAETAKAYTADAIGVLVEIMVNPMHPAAARATCANSLLDRGWGKPAQSLEVSGKDGGPVLVKEDISPLEAARRIAFAIELAAREAAKKEKPNG